MKEIDPIGESDTEIGHIVGIDDKNTIQMTIGWKILEISKTKDMREKIKIIVKTSQNFTNNESIKRNGNKIYVSIF